MDAACLSHPSVYERVCDSIGGMLDLSSSNGSPCSFTYPTGTGLPLATHAAANRSMRAVKSTGGVRPSDTSGAAASMRHVAGNRFQELFARSRSSASSQTNCERNEFLFGGETPRSPTSRLRVDRRTSFLSRSPQRWGVNSRTAPPSTEPRLMKSAGRDSVRLLHTYRIGAGEGKAPSDCRQMPVRPPILDLIGQAVLIPAVMLKAARWTVDESTRPVLEVGHIMDVPLAGSASPRLRMSKQ